MSSMMLKPVSQTEIQPYNESRPAQQSAMAMAEIAKVTQEVQAMCIIARQSPRDVTYCYSQVMKELERYSLAKRAMYAFPRGGQTVSGPSIRMIEMIARNFRNLKYGTKILNLIPSTKDNPGFAECESYCWDTEANNHRSIPFTVRLVRDTKSGPKPLTDERDIYELIANYGARRVRSCIQSMIPADIIEDAIKKTGETIEKGEGSLPFEQRVRNLVTAFERELAVTKEMIFKKFEVAGIEHINKDQFIELYGIYNSLKDNNAKRDDYFTFVTADKTTPQDVTNSSMADAREAMRMEAFERVEKLVAAYLAKNRSSGDSILKMENTIGMGISQIEKQPMDRLLAVEEILKGI